MMSTSRPSPGWLVWAKVRGHPFWPARIVGEANDGARLTVVFFGTQETAVVKPDDLVPHDPETLLRFNRGTATKRRGFELAVQEIEAERNSLLQQPSSRATANIAVPSINSSVLVAKDFSNDPLKSSPATATATKAPKSVLRTPDQSRKRHSSGLLTEDTKTVGEGLVRTSRSGRVLKTKRLTEDFDTAAETDSIINKNNIIITVPHLPGYKVRLLYNEYLDDAKLNRLRKEIESGELVPDELVEQIKAKQTKSASEVALLASVGQRKADKIQGHFLGTEVRMLQLMLAIQRCLQIQKPDMVQALEYLNELKSLQISKLMLLKHGSIVEDIGKLRSYVGPVGGEIGGSETQKIRIKSNQLWLKFMQCFDFSGQVTDFWPFFEAKLLKFRGSTRHLTTEQVLRLVVADYTVK